MLKPRITGYNSKSKITLPLVKHPLQPLALEVSSGTIPFGSICKQNKHESYGSFIPFFVFGFWSLLATKLQKYENIT